MLIGQVVISTHDDEDKMNKDEKTKLILALQQVENITNLIKDNQWETFLVSHLVSVKVEIKRQLSLLNNQGCAS